MDAIEKGRRVVGDTRTHVASEIKEAYEGGETIRSIASRLGRSYGFVHRMLGESGVEFRGRGGNNFGGRPGRKTGARKLSEHEANVYADRLREGTVGAKSKARKR